MVAEGPKNDHIVASESVSLDNMNINESLLDEDDPAPVKKGCR